MSSTNELDLPLIPLRDVVIFPHMVIPLFVGREKSINALEQAMQADKKVMLIAQTNATDDEPALDKLYPVGTVATILQLLKLPDGTVKVLVEGEQRARMLQLDDASGCFRAKVSLLDYQVSISSEQEEALCRTVLTQFENYTKLNKKIPAELLSSLESINSLSRLADTIAAHMTLKLHQKQDVLNILDPSERIEHIIELMETEIELLQIEKRIRGRVKRQMEKSQREYYLNEQMKAIQKELGESEDGANEIQQLHERIEASGMSTEAQQKALSELGKLKMMPPMSAEATVVRSYLDWLLTLPWKKRSKVRHNIGKAQEVLDADHYGLEKVKERILEYLAVQQRVRKLKGPILCLVGPPGVGKTSLGRSIAHATNRKFVRMSLGGVRDEAEIRGHRRTYIGSMPGKIVQKMVKTEVKNPLFLLDEIDKMNMDMRGDPASALLEVLDPEQNNNFSDHYLEVDYDLSEVMFVATANTMNIPAPLLDRMEVIRLSGYTEDEKLNIAKNYLIPKQISANGLKADEIEITDESVLSIIRYYTREAGVRGLERELSKLCRKVVKTILLDKSRKTISIDSTNVSEFLGVQRYSYGKAEERPQIGYVNGLAWTEVGGELLNIEAVATAGKGKHLSTGRLGDVMQESIKAAITVVRSRAESLGLNHDFYEKVDLHIHAPEGATPKDGPSAGITICTAVVSVLTGIPVKADVAMTGEITLRGEVLPIGGLKEKLLAAHRGGIKTVIIPKENERDLQEIPNNVKENLSIFPVKWIDEVLELALSDSPRPANADTSVAAKDEGSSGISDTANLEANEIHH